VRIVSYTPGPWKLTERSGYYEILAASEDCDWYGEAGMHAVAYADTEIDEPEQRANARLIAAAPDLLSALQECLRIIDEIDEYQKRPERGDYGVECACCMGEMFEQSDVLAIDAARAAISRATEGK
jgi:hypothetical protein